MNPTARLTPGRLTALWVVLRTLRDLGNRAEASELKLMARRSGLRAGGLPVPDGLRLALDGAFIFENSGVCALAPLGERALAMSDEEEPPPPAIRLFVTVLFLRRPPAWVAWWQGSPTDFEAVIPTDERKVLQAAGLLPPPSPEDPGGWGWWRALARLPLPEQTAATRKVIGDAGEKLTVAYERARLQAQGYPGLAEEVVWVARESDAYGFDVLSFAGDDHAPLAPLDRIAIEVKSTSLPVIDYFPLFFSAHEWEVMAGLGPRGVLHLWPNVSPGPPASSTAKAPIVAPPAVLGPHLPAPPACGEDCRWASAQLRLTIAVLTADA